MTRDELALAISNSFEESLKKSISAVVELHAPEQTCFDATCYCADNCKHCHSKYPCPTIQSVEKELL